MMITTLRTLIYSIFAGTIVSLLPIGRKECFLGYKAFCSFTPYSAIILIILGLCFWLILKAKIHNSPKSANQKTFNE